VRRFAWLFRLALVVAVAGLGLAAVMVGVIPETVRILNAHEQVPVKLPEFTDLAQRSYVYDASGQEIAHYQLENSQPITIDQVPEAVRQAFIAVEDNEFPRHHGVNLRSLVRALLSNVQGTSSRQGASTITQQVVKLEFLAGLERDARYKILQARYAVLLENKLTKDQILERYLNTVYFGNNAYGVQAAAEVYFGKRVKDLDLIEGAFLAGLVRSPSNYEPINHPERSRARFRQVMTRLADVGLVTQAKADDLAVTWELPEKRLSSPDRQNVRTHFTEAVKDYLLNGSTVLGTTEQERYNALFRGGLRIYTTQDPQLQKLAQEAKDTQLPQNQQGIEAAIVSLDSKTGAVRAMVGGPEFQQGVNELNLALRPRQTGSSIKIFILAAAVQAGAQPTDIIDGTLPCTLPNPGNPKDPFKITSGVTKAPSALQEMTWNSINCAFARLSQIVGLNRLVDLTKKMGVQSPLHPYPSFATGANEITPMDMASGAETVANQGLHHDPYYVERVEGPSGVIYQHTDPGTQVLTPDAANTTVSILKGVLLRGTARRAGFLTEGTRPAAGKTGTQDDNTNAWFVGFTPQLTTAVWVGDPKGYTPMTASTIPEFRGPLSKLGKSTVQGATFPLSIWKAYMEPAHVFLPIEDWPAPPKSPRAPARLYLPGNECLASNGAAPATPGKKGATTTTAVPDPNAPVTAPPLRKIDPGTTIAPDVLDPLAPLPSVPLGGIVVYDCAKGLPVPSTVATTVPAGGEPGTTEAPATTAAEPPASGG